MRDNSQGYCLNKICVVVCIPLRSIHTTTPLKKNEKNYTERCKNRDSQIKL